MKDIMSKVIDLCNKHMGEFRIRGNQAVVKYCPFCHGGEHGDVETFSVGLYNGAFSCLRGGCGVTGGFRELCERFGEQAEVQVSMPFTRNIKTYAKPDPEQLLPVTDDIVTYFALRKISEDTLKAFKICSDEHGNIVFPFYWNDELVFEKFREPRKFIAEKGKRKEWAFQGGKPILFGMDNVSFSKPLFITEGQMDAMSLYEAGVTNVVSVPMGCNNLEFVNLCWDWLEKFQQIILFGDNDEPGTEMVLSLMKRLGEDRCLIAPAYPELIVDGVSQNRLCKDANEILFAYGPDVLKDIADHCVQAPIQGILDLAEVPFVDPTTQPRIFTRVPALDNAIGGLGEGGMTVFSGKRGCGKSTLCGQLLLSAVQAGHSVCAYSGELSATKFQEWIFTQATEAKYIGIKQDQRNGKCYTCIDPEIQQRIKDWIQGKFFLFDNNCTFDMPIEDAIISVFTTCARRFGAKLFLCDNMMTVTSGDEDEVRSQSRFARKLKQFAVKYKVHVILVSHPRKTPRGEQMGNDDVAGSSVITNVADNVIVVDRPNLNILKNRDFGTLDYIECTFNPANRRIYQTVTGDQVVYGWDHTGIKEPEEPASSRPEFAPQVGLPLNAPSPF